MTTSAARHQLVQRRARLGAGLRGSPRAGTNASSAHDAHAERQAAGWPTTRPMRPKPTTPSVARGDPARERDGVVPLAGADAAVEQRDAAQQVDGHRDRVVGDLVVAVARDVGRPHAGGGERVEVEVVEARRRRRDDPQRRQRRPARAAPTRTSGPATSPTTSAPAGIASRCSTVDVEPVAGALHLAARRSTGRAARSRPVTAPPRRSARASSAGSHSPETRLSAIAGRRARPPGDALRVVAAAEVRGRRRPAPGRAAAGRPASSAAGTSASRRSRGSARAGTNRIARRHTAGQRLGRHSSRSLVARRVRRADHDPAVVVLAEAGREAARPAARRRPASRTVTGGERRGIPGRVLDQVPEPERRRPRQRHEAAHAAHRHVEARCRASAATTTGRQRSRWRAPAAAPGR